MRFSNEYQADYISTLDSVWLGLSEITEQLQHRADADPRLKLSIIGYSEEKRPLLLAELTDPTTDDRLKEVAVFIAAEHGGERSATGTVLHLIDFLLDTEEGKEILQKQKLYLVPVVNADGYDTDGCLVNRNQVNLFADYHYDGTPPEQPESRAVFELLEKVRPDIMVSLHGMSPNYDAMHYPRTWESTGVAYTNALETGYSRKFIDLVNRQAQEAGYPIDLGSEDLERLLPPLPGFEYHSMPTFAHVAGSPSYCYARFHSLAFVMEIGAVESGFRRCREILRLGCRPWEYEYVPGYPNRIIAASCIAQIMLTAGGKNASERRQNRIDLWKHSRNIIVGWGIRHPDHSLGWVSRTEADYNRLGEFKNNGALLEYFEASGIPIDRTLKLIGDGWKLPPLCWNDACCGVMRANERHSEKVLHFDGYDQTLGTETAHFNGAIRFRLDRENKVEIALVNDRELSPDEYRVWADDRYGYFETDLPENFLHAVVAVKFKVRN